MGAIIHPDVVDDYLQNEITAGRVVGPFPAKSLPEVHISQFGVIPKNHHPDKWRLIVDLSYPSGHSVNDGIPKDLCSLNYITIDDAVNHILELGCGTHLAKIDIKNAFRLIPVHPTDRHLLGMQWKDGIYIDTCLPFGLRSAPKLFNILAEFMAWILKQQGISHLLHYLDDFLILGPPASNVCQQHLDAVKQVCDMLGVPLALEKVEGPTTCLSFLGITLDTVNMEARLPEEKLQRIQLLVAEWLDKKKATKRRILSLVGQLQHATKVVKHGRIFVARLYSTAAKVREMDFYTRLNMDFRSDICWWHVFLQHWNGISLLRLTTHHTPNDFIIQTDASGSWGCGAFLLGQWLQWEWSPTWKSIGIMAKELAPIVLSCAVWGKLLSHKRVLFQCDNQSVVAAIQKGSSKDVSAMHLLRCLWFFVAYYDIDITSTHIAGITNTTADHLSRNNLSSFFSLNPQALQHPTPLPPSLLKIIALPGQDWTSETFRLQFKATILME